MELLLTLLGLLLALGLIYAVVRLGVRDGMLDAHRLLGPDRRTADPGAALRSSLARSRSAVPEDERR